jgi:hypothetical protein
MSEGKKQDHHRNERAKEYSTGDATTSVHSFVCERSAPCLDDPHPRNLNRLAASGHALSYRAREPGAG